MDINANPNVDAAEIARFEALATQWWNPRGDMGPLHVINPARVNYIRHRVGSLDGLRALDVGCGGGILAEALAGEHALVLGIDLAGASIDAARKHASDNAVSADYELIAAETLAENTPAAFDLVCCMEMLEHVPDPAGVVNACAELVKPGGNVVFSTINRNPKSYALMIVAAEYTLKLLPRGTHEYAKFIRPSELSEWARMAGLETLDVTGLRYNPLLRHASLNARDLDVNYLMHCHRPGSS